MKKIILTILGLVFLHNFLFAQFQLSEKNGKYGYTDKQGNIKIAYKYDEAGSFNRTLFVIVKRNNKYYLIDTIGTEYLLARKIKDLTPKTQAFDLRYKSLKTIPKEVFDYKELEILLLSNNSLADVPDEIENFTNLIFRPFSFRWTMFMVQVWNLQT